MKGHSRILPDVPEGTVSDRHLGCVVPRYAPIASVGGPGHDEVVSAISARAKAGYGCSATERSMR